MSATANLPYSIISITYQKWGWPTLISWTKTGKMCRAANHQPRLSSSPGLRGEISLVSKFKGWKAIAAQQVVGEGGHKYTILVIISRPPVVGVARDLGYKTLLGMLAVLLVGAPFCFLLARHIVNPIVRLSEAAGRIADGWLDTRSGQSIRLRGDEIGRLSVSFDRMAER